MDINFTYVGEFDLFLTWYPVLIILALACLATFVIGKVLARKRLKEGVAKDPKFIDKHNYTRDLIFTLPLLSALILILPIASFLYAEQSNKTNDVIAIQQAIMSEYGIALTEQEIWELRQANTSVDLFTPKFGPESANAEMSGYVYFQRYGRAIVNDQNGELLEVQLIRRGSEVELTYYIEGIVTEEDLVEIPSAYN
jgi:hypothetical protein